VVPPEPKPNDSGPDRASRVIGFATFFKSYMSVWTVVVAALPIPVGVFKLIPNFEAQRSYLSVYTPLFCFLSLGFIFFQRHRLGHYLLRGTREELKRGLGGLVFERLSRGFADLLPLVCILLSVFAVFSITAFSMMRS
jgi:hypothetical protein